VLDVAREQVADARGADAADVDADAADPAGSDPTGSDPAEESGDDDATADAPVELPAPDPSSFAGAHRVVNLFADSGDDGTPTDIDVWARRTFTNGPVLLAGSIGFGEASGYFAAPAGHRLVIVSSGAGPDGHERASLPEVADDEQVTTVFTNGDDARSATTSSWYERGSDRAPAAPGDGHGLVVVFAANLAAFGDALGASVGGDEFFVGDGSAICRTQRIEATGVAPNVLGGPERIELEPEPGPALISLHPSSSPNGCDQPPTIEVTVDVVAGAATAVIVYTADGAGIETLTLTSGG
jgi:hypothetical protein